MELDSQFFIELIQVSLGLRDSISKPPNDSEWKQVFLTCQQQSVVGVAFIGVKRIADKSRQKPPQNILLEWIALSEQIKQRNQLITERCLQLTEIFTAAGFETCILKGQGNALMYPEPLLRQPGDIDIWINASRSKIERFVKRSYPNAVAIDHHIEYPIFHDVEVEVHYNPINIFEGRHRKKMTQFIELNKRAQFQNLVTLKGYDCMVNVPTFEFNIVTQLYHMFRHFLLGGVGMRQIIDYYYLLHNNKSTSDDINKWICCLGLKKFAGAVMWVLIDVLGMNPKKAVVEIDEKRGKLLLEDIITGGNFGKYHGGLSHFFINKSYTLSIAARNFRFLWLFPEEAVTASLSGLIRRIKSIGVKKR